MQEHLACHVAPHNLDLTLQTTGQQPSLAEEASGEDKETSHKFFYHTTGTNSSKVNVSLWFFQTQT